MPQPGGSNDIFINQLVESSLDFDQDTFDRILHNIILHMGFERAITGVIYPFLQKIGPHRSCSTLPVENSMSSLCCTCVIS